MQPLCAMGSVLSVTCTCVFLSHMAASLDIDEPTSEMELIQVIIHTSFNTQIMMETTDSQLLSCMCTCYLCVFSLSLKTCFSYTPGIFKGELNLKHG